MVGYGNMYFGEMAFNYTLTIVKLCVAVDLGAKFSTSVQTGLHQYAAF